jgi:hypothetical protein
MGLILCKLINNVANNGMWSTSRFTVTGFITIYTCLGSYRAAVWPLYFLRSVCWPYWCPPHPVLCNIPSCYVATKTCMLEVESWSCCTCILQHQIIRALPFHDKLIIRITSLGCHTIQCGREVPIFRKNLRTRGSTCTISVEAGGSSKVLASVDQVGMRSLWWASLASHQFSSLPFRNFCIWNCAPAYSL